VWRGQRRLAREAGRGGGRHWPQYGRVSGDGRGRSMGGRDVRGGGRGGVAGSLTSGCRVQMPQGRSAGGARGRAAENAVCRREGE